MNKIKTFLKHPLTTLGLIIFAIGIVFFLSLFLPPLFCLIPPFVCVTVTITLFGYMWGSRDYYKMMREKEYAQNSLFIDELLNENNSYHRRISELRDEKEFLISVIEQYDVRKIN